MASNIYTQTLWQLGPTTVGGSVLGPAVPSGFLWVIRDIVLVSPGPDGIIASTPPGSLYVNTIPVAATPRQGTLQASVFRYEDLRQVITVNDSWGFTGPDAGWQLRVCGYQLSAP